MFIDDQRGHDELNRVVDSFPVAMIKARVCDKIVELMMRDAKDEASSKAKRCVSSNYPQSQSV